MKIIFHGATAASFRTDFENFLGVAGEIQLLSERLDAPGETEAFASADVIIGTALNESHPRPNSVRLYHVAGAGYDTVDLARLPSDCRVCNCFGHEDAIAEYVMAALLTRHVPLHDADDKLRRGDWAYLAGRPGALRQECSGSALGLLGYGHIGKAVARRAKAFGMAIHTANRSLVENDPNVDCYWPLDRLAAFYPVVDAVVVSLPLTATTRGLVDAVAFAAMRPDALVINVGRGPVIDERALYDALHERKIGGAIIDTWYVYPSNATPNPHPGSLPFHELNNLLLTPHMSGWTSGTIRRRQQTMAENIRRLQAGEPLLNVVA